MIAVLQRVRTASVTVDDEVVGAIESGLCILLGVERGDDAGTAARLAAKAAKLRIFADEESKMNRSVVDVGGAVLLVSQFTLAADTSGGNRPSFMNAAPPADAEALYGAVAVALREFGLVVATGRFQAHMLVRIENDGPVTILLRA